MWELRTSSPVLGGLWRGQVERSGRRLNADMGPRCSWRGGALVSDVEVKPSGIEGVGVFATRSLRADDRIRRVNVIREITADAPIREELGERVDHCSYPDGKVVLWGFPDRHEPQL
jgi:hypothetical protein